eukprot:TRINITY_DN30872_c0_g1_i1.p3 TRINITY_DN30872_c0_g1~~TRINITY_DN30872_c0_g1_i1.p3  ORF type:complete len:111 (-),score=4.84 TRINITY_DN30872_c0_g1_i1:72-404(-)
MEFTPQEQAKIKQLLKAYQSQNQALLGLLQEFTYKIKKLFHKKLKGLLNIFQFISHFFEQLYSNLSLHEFRFQDILIKWFITYHHKQNLLFIILNLVKTSYLPQIQLMQD